MKAKRGVGSMEVYELEILQSMTAEQKMFFQSQFNAVRKDTTTGFLFAFFLGGLGAHHFYLGKVGLGVLYAVFCWTLIPALIALVECFFICRRVERWNEAKAREIAMQIHVIHPGNAWSHQLPWLHQLPWPQRDAEKPPKSRAA